MMTVRLNSLTAMLIQHLKDTKESENVCSSILSLLSLVLFWLQPSQNRQ